MNPVSAAKPHFSILATSFPGGPRPRNTALILYGLWFVLFFCSLFAPPLLDDADATHAQAARAMATTGDLVTLRVDGVRYLEKAPLPYWLAALSFKLFGFNTFAAHLPQAAVVLLLMLVGHRWANQAFGARTGYYTSLAILTAAGVFLFTRILIPDALLSLELAAALFAFLKTVQPELRVSEAVANPPVPRGGDAPAEQPAIAFYAGPNFYPYVMWFSLALAVLTKGLVGLVLFGVAGLLYLLLVDELFLRSTWRKLRPFSGIVLLLVVAAPWHVLAALRNPGFLRFYFWNEQVLRFFGRRFPHDYNKLPAWLFWAQHLVWLFPWSLFLPLSSVALRQRADHQLTRITGSLGKPANASFFFYVSFVSLALLAASNLLGSGESLYNALFIPAVGMFTICEIAYRRRKVGLSASPFHRIDAQQRSILLLCLFAGVTLLFFSVSTNQEYYTLPAYLPLLLLVAATITRAEQTYAHAPASRRWLTFAHAAFTGLGLVIAVTLLYGLIASRKLPYTADVGALLARRGVGAYTLSTSHLFDLTTGAFAALRMPAGLATVVFLLGPGLAWMMRVQRRHIAATSTVAFTAAAFLLAAQVAFVRFQPILSSRNFAETFVRLEQERRIEADTEVLLFGDQAFGSSLPFYLGRPVRLVDGRSTSMWFGSTFADAPAVFLSSQELLNEWGKGARKVLFVPAERRDDATALLHGRPEIVLGETSGKLLVTDRPLD